MFLSCSASKPVLLCSTECETLIRHMLVLDPVKRYTITQIKQHKWMATDEDESSNRVIKHEQDMLPGENGVCAFNQDVMDKMCQMRIADEGDIKQVCRWLYRGPLSLLKVVCICFVFCRVLVVRLVYDSLHHHVPQTPGGGGGFIL